MSDWKFRDPKNTAVFTLKSILNRDAWIAQVWHDEDDGAWQFLDANLSEPREEDAAIVSLESISKIDQTVVELADLPLGWCALRTDKAAPWLRKRIVPEQNQ